MSRPIYKELTKEMLKDWGITDIQYNNNEWLINRFWYKNNSKTKRYYTLKICTAIRKHKYTNDKSYPIVSFAYKQQHISLPLARIIYAWFNEKIPNGFVVDHIDNDPFNNKLENLQLLTQEQNLIKRFVDNPANCVNQWAKLNKVKYEIAHKCYVEGKSYEEAVEEINKIFINN